MNKEQDKRQNLANKADEQTKKGLITGDMSKEPVSKESLQTPKMQPKISKEINVSINSSTKNTPQYFSRFNKKKIFISFSLVLVLLIVCSFGYIYLTRQNQEKKLVQEITSYNSTDIANIDQAMAIKLTKNKINVQKYPESAYKQSQAFVYIKDYKSALQILSEIPNGAYKNTDYYLFYAKTAYLANDINLAKQNLQKYKDLINSDSSLNDRAKHVLLAKHNSLILEMEKGQNEN